MKICMEWYRPLITAVAVWGAIGLASAGQVASAGVVRNFTFSSEDEGGARSATMNLKVDYNADLAKWVLTAVVNNTSPTTYGGGVNIPGITAFGFELDPLVPFHSWKLEGQLYNGSTEQMEKVLMATNIASPNSMWSVGDSHLGKSVELSYIVQVDQAHFGALYNPQLALDGTPPSGGGNPKSGPSVYYSEATLTMLFDSRPEFSFFPNGPGNSVTGSPYMRMMRGNGGDLRLTSTELFDVIEEPGPIQGPLVTATPEPSSLLIWAGAMAALGLVMHRRRTRLAA